MRTGSTVRFAVVITAVCFLFLVLGIAATWPIFSAPADTTIFNPHAAGDQHFMLWSIFWGAHALTTDPLNLHNANIYYPEPFTFAYSDMFITSSVMMFPVIALSNNPALVFNALMLAMIVIGGVGCFLLAREVTGNDIAGVFAAIFYMFNPAHFGRIVQVMLFGDHWLPWTAFALTRWTRSLSFESSRNAAGWAAASAMFYGFHALSGSHNAAWGALFVILFFVYYTFERRLWRLPRFWLTGALMGMLTVLMLLPAFWPYLELSDQLAEGRVWAPWIAREGAATPVDLLSAGSPAYRALAQTTGWPDALFGYKPKAFLFPGFTILLLALFGLAPDAKRHKDSDRWYRRTAWALDITIILTAALTLLYAFASGPMIMMGNLTTRFPMLLYVVASMTLMLVRWRIFPNAPHVVLTTPRWIGAVIRMEAHKRFWLAAFLFFFWASLGPQAGLYSIIGSLPLIGLIRVVSRYMVPACFALSVLAAFGVVRIIRQESRKGAAGVLAALMLLFTVEANFAPLSSYRWPQPSPAYAWIGEQAGDFAIYEFPEIPGVNSPPQQMTLSTRHWKNLIVGFTGYTTPEREQLIEWLYANFPSDAALTTLAEHDVRYLLIRSAVISKDDLAWIGNSPRLTLVKRFTDIDIYRLE